MKKLLLLLPLVVSACGGLNGVDGLSEESLSGAVANDYAESKISQGLILQSGESDLIYAGPKYHIGTAYRIEDIQYTPAEDYNYNQTGMAGIVPVDLNGIPTTNGEKFDTDAMIATSKVLPLPSIVRVTNLETGVSAALRVNNRGPFLNSRLMDVSPAAARKLGMTGQTKVQVQIMAEESKKVKDLTNGVVAIGQTGQVVDSAYYVSSGPYTVQVGAYYSKESADAVARRISSIGAAAIVEESGMYKIRIKNLSAEDARSVIQRLRNEENMAPGPGLLKDGRWVNTDSI
ncbi:MAG: septal ring lytic transglycosylase RlpA family protein [Rickettsiales bacterium]|jgi:rare lipoprotein A|nr:septal ring lytic transglycosylase RlpA family protein [Rickettsiales bacterium]